MKHCPKCNCDLPFDSFYTPLVGKNKGITHRHCRACENVIKKARRVPKKFKITNDDGIEVRQCRGCQERKTVDCFYVSSRGHYDSYCKPCSAVRHREWVERNPDRMRELGRARRARNRDKINARERAERAANLEKIRAYERSLYGKNKDKKNEQARARRKQQPERFRLWDRRNDHRRRAMAKENGGYYTTAQLKARIDYYGGKCWMCGKDHETIDHVKPLSKGGTNWPANLRPACRSCNSSKRNTWPLSL